MTTWTHQVEALASYLRGYWKRPHLEVRFGRGNQSKAAYILDPMFIVRQRQSKLQDRGRYTTGIYLRKDAKLVEIGLRTEFCRQNLKDFLNQATISDVKSAVQRLFKLKGSDVIVSWSSKGVAKDTGNKKHIQCIHAENFRDFIGLLSDLDLENDLLNDVGVVMPNTYKNAANLTKDRGTLFYVAVHVKSPTSQTLKKITLVLEHLFFCFYPAKVEQSRNSGLRGKLKTHYEKNKLPIECAYKSCRVNGLANLDAAHIKAHVKGGVDDPKNGVFLCSAHHLKQGVMSPKDQCKIIKASVIKHTVLARIKL